MLILVGLPGLVGDGKLVVNNAVSMAQSLGVSEKSSGYLSYYQVHQHRFPELATSVIMTQLKNAEIAIGNIVGSNIFNLLLLLGVSSVIHPLEFNVSFKIDLFILGARTGSLFVGMFTGIRYLLDRWEALVLLTSYLLYIRLPSQLGKLNPTHFPAGFGY